MATRPKSFSAINELENTMDKYKSKQLFRGIIYFILGIVFLMLFGMFVSGAYTPGPEQPIPETADEEVRQACRALGASCAKFCFLILALCFWRLGFIYIRKSRKLLKKQRPVDLATDDYTLYLRCFNDDSLTERSPDMNYRSEEENVMSVVRKIGKPVAIGCPADKTPPLGAYRIYVGDDEWQDKVVELVERAKLVVLRIGLTEGLAWEVLHCLNNIRDLTRFVLVVPYCKGVNLLSLGNLATNMQVCRGDLVKSTVHYNKPAKGTIASFLYFAQTTDGSYELRQSDIPKRRRLWWLTPYQFLVEKAWNPILKQFGKLSLWRYCAKRLAYYLGGGLLTVLFIGSWWVYTRQNESYSAKETIEFYVDGFEKYPMFVEAAEHLNLAGKVNLIDELANPGMLRLPNEDLVYHFDFAIPMITTAPANQMNNGVAVINHIMINSSREEFLKWIRIRKKAAALELEYLQNHPGEEYVFPEDSPEEIAEAKRLFQSLLTSQQKERCEQLQQWALEAEVNEGGEPTPEQWEKIKDAINDVMSYLNQVPDVRVKAILIRQNMLGKPFYIDEP